MTDKEKVCPKCGGTDKFVLFDIRNNHRLCRNQWHRQNAAESLPACNLADIPGHICASLTDVCEPVASVEAKEKVCPNCKHKSHYALRCGALISTGSGQEWDGDILCECLNWVAEPKPTPSTPAGQTKSFAEQINSLWTGKETLPCGCPANSEYIYYNSGTGHAHCVKCGDAYTHESQLKPQPDSSSISTELPARELDIAIPKATSGMLLVMKVGVDAELKRRGLISTEQTFGKWYRDTCKSPGQFGHGVNDLRAAWNAAKGQR